MSMAMFAPNSYATIYKSYYRLTGTSSWNLFTSADGTGPVVNNAYDATYGKGTYTYTVQSTGFYKLDAYGAQGGNYGSYAGGYGGEAPKSA